MPRPVTLFTGQWADLPLESLARKARDFGYQGLELACWGDHFDVTKAVKESGYCAVKRDVLERHDLSVYAISNHLVGQAVCDRIDDRHKNGTSRSCRRTSGATASPTASTSGPPRR